MSLAETLAVVWPLIRDDIADAVAQRLKSTAPDYDSRTALPRGVTGRAFRVKCKCIPEARQEGKVWRCPREAWHASFRQADRTPAAPELDAYELAARGLR
jgi:hypothetical protein